MEFDKKLPQPGDFLIHRYQKSQGEVMAEVLSVDEKSWKISVRVGTVNYASLSAAAEAQTGHHTNGWTFWGLKKHSSRRPGSSNK